MVKSLLPGLFAATILLTAAAAQADDTAAKGAFGQDAAEPRDRAPTPRRAPRIVFGETEQTDFQFRELRPLRRSAASTRQAYFGSGETYSETLSRLQEQMTTIRARQQLEGLRLTPAQQAAKDGLAPALVRALALSQLAREQAAN